jgi:hypothetical protein
MDTPELTWSLGAGADRAVELDKASPPSQHVSSSTLRDGNSIHTRQGCVHRYDWE